MRGGFLLQVIFTALVPTELMRSGRLTAGSKRPTGVRILENQTFSKTLFILWDVRVNTQPEFSDHTRVKLDSDGQGNLTVAFVGFNRTWRIQATANDFLLPERLPAELRTVNGTRIAWLSQSLWQPIRGRLYLGTVDAGDLEQGWAALVYTGDDVRAYITTNINDYMLNVPIANRTALDDSEYTAASEGKAGAAGVEGMIERSHLATDGISFAKRLRQKRTASGNNSTTSKGVSANQHLQRTTDFISLGPLPRPVSGYDLYAEMSVFIDQTWLESLTSGFGIDRDAALVYTAELMHYAQVWYLHPSLGYRMWLRLNNFIIFNDSYPAFARENFEQLCKWQSDIPVDVKSDFFLLLTGNQKNCNGLGGMAYPNEACNSNFRNRQCACIYHQKLQTNTLIRTVAHEIGHLIGMPDDYSGRTSQLCYSGLMRYGVYEDSGWSTCAVQNLERFLFIQGNTCLHKSETNATVEPPRLPRNIAWRTHAWQSSTLDDDEASWGAWKATDGHIFGVPYENSQGTTANLLGHLSSCSQTKVESRPWLVLELERTSTPQDLLVHVYGREECCELSLDNLTVAIGQQRDPWKHRICRVFQKSGQTGKYKLLSVRCQAGGADSFLSIVANGATASLSVCEVYVFQDQAAQPFSHAAESCFDDVRYCDEWKVQGDCQTESRQYCRRTCGICGATNRRAIAKPKYKRPPAPTQCKDSHRYCRFYAANGLCTDKWSHCPLSCNRCNQLTVPTTAATATTTTAGKTTVKRPSTGPLATKPGAKCADRDSNCEYWVREDYCSHEHIAHDYCRLSCGTC